MMIISQNLYSTIDENITQKYKDIDEELGRYQEENEALHSKLGEFENYVDNTKVNVQALLEKLHRNLEKPYDPYL